MMNSRERVQKALRHEPVDRLPILDTPWASTFDRWKKEGMPAEMANYTSMIDYFDFDIIRRGYAQWPFTPEVVEKTDKFIIETTVYGGKTKNLLDFSSTPEMIEWPIANHEDWDEMEPKLQFDQARFEKDLPELREQNKILRDTGRFIVFHGGGINYDILQNFLKTEELMMALITDPSWVKQMAATITKLFIERVRACLDAGLEFDGGWACSDMGYKNALLFSPKVYREVFQESDKMLMDFFHSRDLPFILHSCGNVSEIIPDLIDSGFDCLMPLEVKAGMDLVELKEKYGDKIALMGGIDVRKMNDPEEYAKELDAKLPAAKKGSGYIYHSDHSVPKDVSFENFCKSLELVRERW